MREMAKGSETFEANDGRAADPLECAKRYLA